MPKADLMYIHLPGFFRGFGLRDHTVAFTPVLESQAGKELLRTQLCNKKCLQREKVMRRKKKNSDYLKRRGKKKIKRDASVPLSPRTAQPFPDF